MCAWPVQIHRVQTISQWTSHVCFEIDTYNRVVNINIPLDTKRMEQETRPDPFDSTPLSVYPSLSALVDRNRRARLSETQLFHARHQSTGGFNVDCFGNLDATTAFEHDRGILKLVPIDLV